MGTALTDLARRLLDEPNFAVIATLGPRGEPQSSTVWIDRDGDDVVFSLTADKQKARNLARDPRVSVAVFDRANPYSSVEIRGTVTLEPDPAKELPERLSQKYLGQSPVPEPDATRLIARVTVTRVNEFAP